MLEQGFSVTTSLFEVTTPQPHFINDRCFGEDFAAWLRVRLAPHVASVSEPIQEDWGWTLVAEFNGSSFTIAIGVMDESIGETPAEWRVGVSYERGMNLRALFRKKPVEDFAELARIVERILEAEPAMKVMPADD